MKIKNVKLEYYVIHEDFNSRKLKRYNILNDIFKENLAEQIKKKKITNLVELKEWLKRDFMYHYWSKSEWELAIGGLFAKHPEEFEKIDVWYQIENNLDMIVDYINNKMELNFN